MSQNQTTSSSASVSSYRNNASAGPQVYFIDASVSGYEVLSHSLSEDSKVFVIENTSDAFIQIDRALASLSDPASSVHIYSHGRDGAILLGGQWIDEAALSQRSEILKSIGKSLAQGADILLYGCTTGAAAAGRTFVSRLAALTGADVAASDDMTGTGGNWALEVASGDIESVPRPLAGWKGVLAASPTVRGTTGNDSLRADPGGSTIDGLGGADTITGSSGADYIYYYGAEALIQGGEGIDTLYVRNTAPSLDISRLRDIEVARLEAPNGKAQGPSLDISGSLQAMTLIGNAAGNLLRGGKNRDLLDGGAGNDTLHGSAAGDSAGDTLSGGAGNDVYYLYKAGDTITDSAGKDLVYSFIDYTLAGDLEDLVLQGDAVRGTGNALNNRIEGQQTRACTLDGGAGKDTLIGGSGNDLFLLDNSGDVIIDSGGDNSVKAWASVDLRKFNARITSVSLQGDGNINATAGLNVAATLTGNAGRNVLTGSAGSDVLSDWGGGADTLAGGKGDDSYNVYDTRTVVVEKANEGIDTVTAFVEAHTLAANVENLVLADTASRYGVGNNLANRITAVIPSNAHAGRSHVVLHGGVNDKNVTAGDTLIGGTGNDQFYSYNAMDSIVSGGGADVLYISYAIEGGETMSGADLKRHVENAVGAPLSGNITVLYRGNPTATKGQGARLDASSSALRSVASELVGTARADTLRAGILNSTLDGGTGGDSMIGGQGADIFYVDNVGTTKVVDASQAAKLGDIVVANDTRDTIRSSVSLDLNRRCTIGADTFFQYSGVGAVQLLGTAGLTASGYNDAATHLVGNVGNNKLTGGAGNDTLDGAAGADIMTGGDGDDLYFIDHVGDSVRETAKGGLDTIWTAGININLGSANHRNVEVVRHTDNTKAISIIGTAAAESLFAGNTGDTLDGKGGNDCIQGGAGNDLIYYYDGLSFSGGGGADTLKVHNAVDALSLKDEQNVGTVRLDDVKIAKDKSTKGTDINGNALTRAIHLIGNAADNSLSGGSGNDTIIGGGGKDSIAAGKGNDMVVVLPNAAGYGSLDGGAGQDTLSFGDVASYTLYRGNGLLQLPVNAKKPADGPTVKASGFEVLAGGAGNDTLAVELGGDGVGWIWGADGSVAVGSYSASAGVTTTPTIKPDITVMEFEHYKGTSAGNFFDARQFASNGGNLTLEGGDGQDAFYLGDLTSGKVLLDGKAGSDIFHIGALAKGTSLLVDGGKDTAENALYFDTKTDVSVKLNAVGNITTASMGGVKTGLTAVGITSYTGGSGNDLLDASSVTSVNSALKIMNLSGGAGNDVLRAGKLANGFFVLDGGAGSDSMVGSAGNDYFMLGESAGGGASADTVVTGGGYDRLVIGARDAGSSVTVKDFDVNKDVIDHMALLASGWTCSKAGVDGGTLLTYKRTSNGATFSVLLEKVASTDLKLTSGAELPLIQGTDDKDVITVRGGNNSIMVVGGKGNDALTVLGDITGGTYKLYGTAGADTIAVAGIAGGVTDLEAEKITTGEISGGQTSLAGDAVVVTKVSGGSLLLQGGDTSAAHRFTLGDVSNARVTLQGGASANTLYMGNIAGSTVSVMGGTGNEAFHVGNISGSTISLSGGEGMDSLYFDGSSAVHLALRSGTKPGAGIILDGIDVIHGTGLSDYLDATNYMTAAIIDGGNGNDTLVGSWGQTLTGGKGDDLLIVTALNGITAIGGVGNDTFSLESLTASSTYTLSGNSLNASSGSATLQEMENIRLSGRGDRVVLQGKTATTLISSGNDTLTLTEAAAGSELHIKGYAVGKSRIDATALAGWSQTSVIVNGSSKNVFSKAGKTITVWLDDVAVLDYSASTTGVKITAGAGSTVLGGLGADSIRIGLSNISTTYVNTGSGSAQDTLTIATMGYEGWGDNISTLIGNGNDILAFENALGANIIIGELKDDASTANLVHVNFNGRYHGMPTLIGGASVDSDGFSKFVGTTGADIVAVNSNRYYFYPDKYVEYATNGGDDTFFGGYAIDKLHVTGLGAGSKVSLNGNGDGGDDIIYLEDNKATRIVLDNEGDVGGMTVAGQAVAIYPKIITVPGPGEKLVIPTGAAIKGFERYHLVNNTNDLFDARNFTDYGKVTVYSEDTVPGIGKTMINVARTDCFYEVATGGGNDTILIGNANLGAFQKLRAYGEDGDDVLNIGTVTTSGGGTALLSGGAGKDVYQVQAKAHQLTIQESGVDADRLEIFGATAITTLAELSSKVSFRTSSDGATITLRIAGLDGKGNRDNALVFVQENFSGDVMRLYSDQGKTSQLGGDVDLAAVVAAIGKNSGWTNLTFQDTGTLLTPKR